MGKGKPITDLYSVENHPGLWEFLQLQDFPVDILKVNRKGEIYIPSYSSKTAILSKLYGCAESEAEAEIEACGVEGYLVDLSARLCELSGEYIYGYLMR